MSPAYPVTLSREDLDLVVTALAQRRATLRELASYDERCRTEAVQYEALLSRFNRIREPEVTP